MPWQIALPLTLFLFVVAPFFRKWIDLVVWPKLADWWASRSRSTIEKRITKLERLLAQIEPLPSLTDFEDIVLRGLAGIIAYIMIIPLLAEVAYQSFYPSQWAANTSGQLILFLVVTIFLLVGIGMQTAIDKFRRHRLLKYRELLRKDIDRLRAVLQ